MTSREAFEEADRLMESVSRHDSRLGTDHCVEAAEEAAEVVLYPPKVVLPLVDY